MLHLLTTNDECLQLLAACFNPRTSFKSSLARSSYVDKKLSEGEGSARLVLNEVTRLDTGLYFCHAYNSLGTSVPVATALIVTREGSSIVFGDVFPCCFFQIFKFKFKCVLLRNEIYIEHKIF